MHGISKVKGNRQEATSSCVVMGLFAAMNTFSLLRVLVYTHDQQWLCTHHHYNGIKLAVF